MNEQATEPGVVMQAMVAAFDSGDLSRVEQVIHPGYVDHQGLPDRRPMNGVEDFAEVVRTARSGYRHLAVTIVDLLTDGDRAAARIEWTGVRVSGEHVRRETIDIVRVRDGRAIEHWGARS